MGGSFSWVYRPLPAATAKCGTLLTLLPVALDLVRRYYIRTRAPPPNEFTDWALAHVRATLLGYEWLYALAVFFDVSLMALGFAMDLTRPEGA